MINAEYRERFMNKPDFILLNGKIWTGNILQPWAEAFAVSNGRFTTVGSNDEIKLLAAGNTEIFDAEQRLVIPGFTDSHVHFLLGGLSLLEVNLYGMSSRAQIEEAIRQKINELPQGSWIRGSGWDNSRWTPPNPPDRKWLDTVCPDNPLYLTREDMHSAVANSRAMEQAGITRDTPDPDGGRIERYSKSGEPNGILDDAAMKLVERIIPSYSTEMRIRAIEAACREAPKQGITSVHDMSLLEDIEFLTDASHKDYFNVRMHSFPPILAKDEISEIKNNLDADTNKFRIAGLKVFTDGSFGSRTAYMFEPYIDVSYEYYGLAADITLNKENFLRIMQEADADGFQLAVHSIGDRANAELLDVFEKILAANGERDRRWRIEHAQHLRPEDIKRYRNLGITASMQPYHCINDARFMSTRIELERCAQAFVFKSLFDAGVPLIFGSDWNVSPLIPLVGIDAAVNRIPVGGGKPWFPEQAISLEEAFKAYTVNPPKTVFAEADQGSIEPGKFADCALLSQNLFCIPPASIPGVEVDTTIFNGRVVYEK